MWPKWLLKNVLVLQHQSISISMMSGVYTSCVMCRQLVILRNTNDLKTYSLPFSLIHFTWNLIAEIPQSRLNQELEISKSTGCPHSISKLLIIARQNYLTRFMLVSNTGHAGSRFKSNLMSDSISQCKQNPWMDFSPHETILVCGVAMHCFVTLRQDCWHAHSCYLTIFFRPSSKLADTWLHSLILWELDGEGQGGIAYSGSIVDKRNFWKNYYRGERKKEK